MKYTAAIDSNARSILKSQFSEKLHVGVFQFDKTYKSICKCAQSITIYTAAAAVCVYSHDGGDCRRQYNGGARFNSAMKNSRKTMISRERERERNAL